MAFKIPPRILILYYWLMDISYYQVHVLSSQNKVIKKFLQVCVESGDGLDIALVCRPIKSAWWKKTNLSIDDKGKILIFVREENAIPLIEKTEKFNNNHGFFTIATNKVILDIDREKYETAIKSKDKKDSTLLGYPIEFVELGFPPTLFFQETEGGFVRQIVSDEPQRDWSTVVIAVCIAIVIIAWMLLNHGGLGGIV